MSLKETLTNYGIALVGISGASMATCIALQQNVRRTDLLLDKTMDEVNSIRSSVIKVKGEPALAHCKRREFRCIWTMHEEREKEGRAWRNCVRDVCSKIPRNTGRNACDYAYYDLTRILTNPAMRKYRRCMTEVRQCYSETLGEE